MLTIEEVITATLQIAPPPDAVLSPLILPPPSFNASGRT